MELNRIYNEECLAGMAAHIPDQSIDAIICDLPYGTTRNKWDTIIPLDELWAQYKRVIKPNGAIVLFAQTPFDKVLGASNLEMLKYEWIWQKVQGTGFLNAKKMPLKVHENILVFYKDLPIYNAQMTQGDAVKIKKSASKKHTSNYGNYKTLDYNNADGLRYPTDILTFKYDKVRFHPTQKPVNLVSYLVRTYTNEGGVILDNCMGLGTTAVACIRERRNFVGFELNKEYYAYSCERIRDEIRKIKEQQTTQQQI